MQMVSALALLAQIMSGEPPSLDRDTFLHERYRSAPHRDFEDFGWKDPKAAIMMGMDVRTYVIEGMTIRFRESLFRLLVEGTLHGADLCINAGYRGPERQALITTGVHAPIHGSFHGGVPKTNKRGHGQGVAADVTSCNKRVTDDERWLLSIPLWRWVDEHGKEFGLGRPYLWCDAPHVAPTDGSEYTSRYKTALARFKDGKVEMSRCPSVKKKKGPNNKKKKRRR